MEDTTTSFDFSSAAKFFTEAVKLAHEKGKNGFEEDDLVLKEIPVESGGSVGASIYDDLPDISFKKFYAEEGTKFNREICRGYHKIIIIKEGSCFIETDEGSISLPSDKRKFYYLEDGVSFTIEFFEDTWFYVISLPS